ncbi:MAG: penicillin-binding protein 2 [Candidatus Paracaedibacteraceae bacterium]|nr:penicillin-binding protein 2 [Candidatus Paracaedibacteraceae bacterium]
MAQLLLVLLLIGRLFFLQVVSQEKYINLSDRNRIRVTLETPLRGSFKDRAGNVFAHSVPYYNLHIDCPNLECWEKCSKKFNKIGVKVDFENLFSHTNKVLLKERLTWEEIALIEANKSDLPMASIQVLYERAYPLDQATPHILGYTSRIAKDHPYAKKLPYSNVGRSGLEKLMDEKLFGKPSIVEEEVNAYGETIRTLSFQSGQTGEDIFLTLDIELQQFLYQKLQSHKSGAAVVLDVNTGEIMGLVSYPSFNPGIFEKGLSRVDWDKLKKDIQTPLLDKTIMGMYPVGSIIKPLIALAALEEGYITPQTRFTCNGVVVIDGQPCHCWKAGGHGSLNLEEALRKSCNIYMYEIAKIMPLEFITKWLYRFGLGQKTGFLAPGEKAGLLPSSEWKLKNRKDRWRRIDTVYLTIGQGYILTTPLQLVRMVAQIVNGGNEITPHILLDKIERKPFKKIEATKHYLDFLTQVMGQVINHPEGTSYRSRLKEVEWQMGGKSGTAQVRKITQRERSEGRHHGFDWQWKEKDHALFVGFAPLSKPKYAIVVLVEHGGFGGVTAAPLGRDIMQFIMQKYNRRFPNI